MLSNIIQHVISLSLSIYIYIYMYRPTPNPPTNIVDFRGFDSSTILILRG